MAIDSKGIFSCSDTCRLDVNTPVLTAVFCADHDFTDTELFNCGYCAYSGSWTIPQLLWSTEDEFLVTPCCHVEAIVALDPHNPKEEGNDQAREDYESYVYAVTGR